MIYFVVKGIKGQDERLIFLQKQSIIIIPARYGDHILFVKQLQYKCISSGSYRKNVCLSAAVHL